MRALVALVVLGWSLTARSDDARPALVVTLAADGTLSLATPPGFTGRSVAAEEVDRELRRIAAHDKHAPVTIVAPRPVPYRRAIQLVDRARAAGLDRVAIGVAPRPVPAPPRPPPRCIDRLR